MPNRGRPSIELPLDRAVAIVSKIGVEAAAEELGVSRDTLRRRLDAAGFTNRRPVRAGRKKTKFTAEEREAKLREILDAIGEKEAKNA